MKKVTVFAFLLALATGASAQSALTVGPNAHGKNVGGTALPGSTATNSTVNVPPVAKVGPNAVNGKKK
jgi:hypothetical protein